MHPLLLSRPGERLSVLCLGAHSDDIEIGAGGLILGWITAGVPLDVRWCVASAAGPREAEAKDSAASFLAGAAASQVETADFRDGHFPHQGSRIKDWVEGIKQGFRPDVVLTHRRDDAHQDHRELNQHSWTTFRDHLILEYEIPKWDGDLGRPNLYVPVTAEVLDRKIDLLMTHFGTQRAKDWFDPETFRGLARLRGMECRAPSGYAEAFVVRKMVLGTGLPGQRP